MGRNVEEARRFVSRSAMSNDLKYLAMTLETEFLGVEVVMCVDGDQLATEGTFYLGFSADPLNSGWGDLQDIVAGIDDFDDVLITASAHITEGILFELRGVDHRSPREVAEAIRTAARGRGSSGGCRKGGDRSAASTEH